MISMTARERPIGAFPLDAKMENRRTPQLRAGHPREGGDARGKEE
jgi:hypothetical protein